MKVKTKFLLTFVAVLLGSVFNSVNASEVQKTSQNETDNATCLVVKLQDGGESIFFLGKSPKLMFFSYRLAVVFEKPKLNFALKDF